jgi:O-succinylhomoserine sulfhydrylase
MNEDLSGYQFETLAVRAGQVRSAEQEQSEAIFPTSSYVFDSAADAAARFSGEKPGNIYSRFTNPTVRNFEKRLAALEGAERCIATGSGMSAILSTFMGLLESGDHVVASKSLFGSTISLLKNILSKFGIQATFVTLSDNKAWEQAILPNTKLLFMETPSNPLTEVGDIQAVANIAHAHDCLLVVDNCFATPALQLPLLLGADLIIHSATKYIDGQGRAVGGAVLGKEKQLDSIFNFVRSAGPTLSPFHAWIYIKGLETLKIRMDAHCKNALALASWLEQQPRIERVYYPGLPSHPQYDLVQKQQTGSGGIVAFELKGGLKNSKTAAWSLIDQTKLLSITANLGDTKTTITHPATTTHARISPEDRASAGISDSLIRIAVGLENISDIQADLEQGVN